MVIVNRSFVEFDLSDVHDVEQGLIIMSMSPDLAGSSVPKATYTAKLKEAAGYWSQCSNEGQASAGSYTFCKYTLVPSPSACST